MQRCVTYEDLESDGEGKKKFKYEDGVFVGLEISLVEMGFLDRFSITFN